MQIGIEYWFSFISLTQFLVGVGKVGKMSRYLISGVAGFIASGIARKLLASGHEVVGIDNLNDSYDVRLKQYRLNILQNLPGFKFRRMDISRMDEVFSLAEGTGKIDCIFNIAGRAGVRMSVENPWAYYETNTIGTLNLLELCKTQCIPKFILASTSSVYGLDAPQPTTELADSSHPLQPYAASKKAAETLAYSYHYLHGIDVTIFRYFTVYGPIGRPDMAIFRFIQWICEGRIVYLYGDGIQSRGFTYLDDIVQGTIQGLKLIGYEIINLGGHQVISIQQLIDMLEKCLGKKSILQYLPANKADMQTNWADISKAKLLLDWEPTVDLEEGINRTVDWYIKERSWASHIQTT